MRKTHSPPRYLNQVSASTVKLWEVESGQLLQIFSGHTDAVNSVAFSPDGSRVLTGSSTALLSETTIPPEDRPTKLGSIDYSSQEGISLNLEGAAGARYEIQSSTDLVTWQTASNVTLDQNSEGSFSQAEVPNDTKFFYRAGKQRIKPKPGNKRIAKYPDHGKSHSCNATGPQHGNPRSSTPAEE